MVEKVLDKFIKFDRPKEGQEFVFDQIPYCPLPHRVRFVHVFSIPKFVEFVPRMEKIMTLSKGWREERIEIFNIKSIYLLLYVPRGGKAAPEDTPFILIERKPDEKKDKWETIGFLYYHYYLYTGIHLTTKASVEYVIETAIRDGWEVKLET